MLMYGKVQIDLRNSLRTSCVYVSYVGETTFDREMTKRLRESMRFTQVDTKQCDFIIIQVRVGQT